MLDTNPDLDLNPESRTKPDPKKYTFRIYTTTWPPLNQKNEMVCPAENPIFTPA
jgi:hypothetical protein